MTSPSSPAVRTAFSSAVGAFLATADRIDDDVWTRGATGAWSVRQLFAHTVRGMQVMTEYLDAEAPEIGAGLEGVLPDAAAYFRVALGFRGAHAGIADRGVAAAAAAGADLPAWAREVGAAAIERVANTPDDRVVVHLAGSIRFPDYLVTRVTELVLHTADLQIACGLPVAAPTDASELVADVLTDLVDRVDPLALALALSGRSGHVACDVLG